MMEQKRLDSLRVAAQLGKGMELSDVQKAPDSQVLGLYRQMSDAVLTLVAEVERLQTGIDAVRAEAERFKKIGDDSVKEPGLSWYQEDHYHNERQAIGMAAEDILEALEKGLGENE